MQIQTGLEPLADRRQSTALKLSKRLLRDDGFWKNYIPVFPRLKTQRTFLTLTRELSDRYKIPDADRVPLFRPPIFQNNIYRADCCLDLILPVSKKISTDSELKMATLATIDEHYPSSVWFHVYTDGSAVDAIRNGGAGVYSKSFRICQAVGKYYNSYNGEVASVQLALEEIRKGNENNIVFFIDSQASIRSLSSIAPSSIGSVYLCQMAISSLLEEGRQIVLQWIPSHCGIAGNDAADKLANAGSDLQQPSPALEYHTVKRLIKSNIASYRRNVYKICIKGKAWASLLTKSIPCNLHRAVGVANFRLKTGHDYLQKHLHRLDLKDSPICSFCGLEDMTGDHLYTCPGLSDVAIRNSAEDDFSFTSRLYWAARQRLIVEKPRSGVG